MGAGEKLLILIFLSVCGAFAVDENDPTNNPINSPINSLINSQINSQINSPINSQTNARLQFRPLGGGQRARNNFTSQVKKQNSSLVHLSMYTFRKYAYVRVLYHL